MGLMHLIDFPPVVKRWLSHPIQILSCLGSFQRLSKLWSTGTTRRNVCDGVEVWRSPLAIPSSRAVGGETCCKVHTCLPVGLNRVFMHKRYTDYVLLRIHTNTYIYIYMVTPPPWSTYKHFIWELPVFYAHFFTRKMTFSCFYFFYLLRKLPTQTHTHAILFLFTFLSFLEVLVKNPKNIEKTKKTKKNKIARPM